MSPSNRHRCWRLLALAGLAALGLSHVSTSTAASILLSDGNSAVELDPANQDGITRWSVKGQDVLTGVNQSRQWFYFRIGDTVEVPLGGTLFQSATQSGTNKLTANYSTPGPGFRASLDFNLQGNPIDFSSLLGTGVTITNTTPSGFLFHLFMYSNFDLPPSASNNVATALAATAPFRVLQSSSPGSPGIFAETQTNPIGTTGGPNHYQIGSPATILGLLTDPNPTTLNDTPPPGVQFGPGDTAFALEWDLNIAAGQSVQFGIAQVVSIPEPSSIVPAGQAALGALFLVGYVRWRRRRATA